MSEQNKSLVVGAGTKQKPLGQKSNPTNFLAMSDHFESEKACQRVSNADQKFFFANLESFCWPKTIWMIQKSSLWSEMVVPRWHRKSAKCPDDLESVRPDDLEKIQIIHKCILHFIYILVSNGIETSVQCTFVAYLTISQLTCYKFLCIKSYYSESFHFLWLFSGGHGGKKVIIWFFRDFRPSQEYNFNSSIFVWHF